MARSAGGEPHLSSRSDRAMASTSACCLNLISSIFSRSYEPEMCQSWSVRNGGFLSVSFIGTPCETV